MLDHQDFFNSSLFLFPARQIRCWQRRTVRRPGGADRAFPSVPHDRVLGRRAASATASERNWSQSQRYRQEGSGEKMLYLQLYGRPPLRVNSVFLQILQETCIFWG